MISKNALLVLFGLLLLAGAFSWLWHARLPEIVPTHWNASGEADDFGPRWKLTILMPSMMVGLVLLLHFLPLLGPFRANIESFRPTFDRIVVLAMSIFVAIHVLMLLKAEGRDIPMERAIPILVGILLAGIGNWLGKLRRNFYIGIRTPWTIANDEVWEKTHRLGGRVFVAYGLAMILAGLLLEGPQLLLWIGGLMLVALFLGGYSYAIYRRLGQIDHLD